MPNQYEQINILIGRKDNRNINEEYKWLILKTVEKMFKVINNQ